MATKAEVLADPNSCLNRAGDDEPIFVLRAHDIAAIRTVQDWIMHRQRAVRHGQRPETDWPQIQEAHELVSQMIDWQYDNLKPPDRK